MNVNTFTRLYSLASGVEASLMGLARPGALLQAHGILFSLLQVWQAALAALSPNPTDSCPLYLNHATVAVLPSRVSRHNSPSSANFVSRLVRTCLPAGNERCIVVRFSSLPDTGLLGFYIDRNPSLCAFPKNALQLVQTGSVCDWFCVRLVQTGSAPPTRVGSPSGVVKLCVVYFQMVCERADVFASSCAISRAFPTFSRRSASSRRTEKKKVTVEFIVVGQEGSSVEPAELQVPPPPQPTGLSL